ncbi:alpha/beta hydrolase [Bacteroides sp. 51]|uniref:alpha/beta hydrolase n=1 Tax=Bacteroides sp. 51 TaxID=2302938 RepID=UPI0013D4052D|nr:alpha/beta hydrolase [Bacteroides sp. 51]NDV84456.1 alpha/beta hydrolase [Bacteroides sp. 51]
MKKHCLTLSFLLILSFLFTSTVLAQDIYKTERDIPYIPATEKDAYRMERCKLDVYYPEGKTNFATVVWFHGGGLEGGNKHIPRELTERGFAVVSVNYRLSPKATHPAYIEDAAEAVAWTVNHIGKYGGNKERIVVSGHSAGGYLALILALDKSYLAKHSVDADQMMAWFPLSGQTVTHYTIRKERKMPDGIPFIDAFAPIQHARKDTPPIHLVAGDRRLEMMARYEENAHLYAVLKGVGNERVYLYELQGFDHGSMCAPGCMLLVEYLNKHK